MLIINLTSIITTTFYFSATTRFRMRLQSLTFNKIHLTTNHSPVWCHMTLFPPITKSHLISKFSVSDALLVYTLSVFLLSCSNGDQRIDHSEIKVKANSKKEDNSEVLRKILFYFCCFLAMSQTSSSTQNQKL